jgi:pimeloyl-ACP methyl ester carboxylesterase
MASEGRVQMHSHLVDVGGAVIHYLEAGSVDAPAVVLIHDGSYGASGRATWEPTIAALAGQYRVLAPDLLGYGRSDKLVDFARDPRSQAIGHIARWLATVRVTEAAFVGNSFGGTLVLYAAIRKAWPVRKVVTICGSGGLHMIAERYRPLREYPGTPEGMRSILERFISERFPGFDDLARRRYEDSLVPGHMEALGTLRREHPSLARGPDWRTELVESLHLIDVPTLVVAGAADVLLEPEWTTTIAQRIPRSEVFTVDRGRHQPHIDHAEVVNPTLLRFLGP